MGFVASNQLSSAVTVSSTVVREYAISFDNRYMITGFVNASMISGTPFVNMWGNVTVDSLLSTDKKGVTTRINRRLQSQNQDNISVAYDEDTLNSILALIRICRWPDIAHYSAFLSDAYTTYPVTVANLETNQYVSQPIDIDIDHTIFTTQYADWNTHTLVYSGLEAPQLGDIWSGGLVLSISGTTMTLGEYDTHDVMFGNDDPFVPTYIEKLTVTVPTPGYQYLRAVGYDTPFIRADEQYTLEWMCDSPDVVSTELYCRDTCCTCDGTYYGSFS
ncbi:MAG: hypothetical protein M0R50_06850, partial [Candidatus Cloacimonetes bacterium]|nr:hypothetical protein [Candidatus Cloacimonadota bacterium]